MCLSKNTKAIHVQHNINMYVRCTWCGVVVLLMDEAATAVVAIGRTQSHTSTSSVYLFKLSASYLLAGIVNVEPCWRVHHNLFVLRKNEKRRIELKTILMMSLDLFILRIFHFHVSQFGFVFFLFLLSSSARYMSSNDILMDLDVGVHRRGIYGIVADVMISIFICVCCSCLAAVGVA